MYIPFVNRNKRRWGLIIVFSVIIIALAINSSIVSLGEKNTATQDNAPNAQVAIVLGAYVHPNGQLSDMLNDRVKTGVELYKAGKVKKLLMSGDHGQKSYDEVNNMRKYAESLGVPTEDIFMDHAGFSTYESMYRARDIFKVESAIIVTQRFHLPRAIYIAKRMGLDVVGVPADKHVYRGLWYNELREIPARLKAFLQTDITKAQPTFLGNAIPIDGDGRATHDGK